MGTWQRRGYRLIKTTIIKVMATKNPSHWYALADQAIWFTEDSGLNWRKIYHVGGRDTPRWITSFQGDPAHLWFITAKEIYRRGPPPQIRRYDLRHRYPQALLKVPDLAEFVRRILKHNRVYFAQNQEYREQSLLAAFLPKITAAAHYNITRDIINIGTYKFPFYPFTYYNTAFDTGTNIEVMANWELGQLLFRREGLPHWERIERNLSGVRQDLTEQTHRLYLEYRRIARLLVYEPPASELVRQYHEIRLQEITAYLDGLSGGYWSKAIGGAS